MIAGEDRSGALSLGGLRASVAKAAGHSDLVSTEGSARQHGRGIARAIPVGELSTLRKPSFRGDAAIAEEGEKGEATGEHPATKGVMPVVGPLYQKWFDTTFD